MLSNVYGAQCTVQCTANAISNKKRNCVTNSEFALL